MYAVYIFFQFIRNTIKLSILQANLVNITNKLFKFMIKKRMWYIFPTPNKRCITE